MMLIRKFKIEDGQHDALTTSSQIATPLDKPLDASISITLLIYDP